MWQLIAHPFLLVYNIPLSGCTIIYSPAEGQQGRFQRRVIMNNPAVNVRRQVFVCA